MTVPLALVIALIGISLLVGLVIGIFIKDLYFT